MHRVKTTIAAWRSSSDVGGRHQQKVLQIVLHAHISTIPSQMVTRSTHECDTKVLRGTFSLVPPNFFPTLLSK